MGLSEAILGTTLYSVTYRLTTGTRCHTTVGEINLYTTTIMNVVCPTCYSVVPSSNSIQETNEKDTPRTMRLTNILWLLLLVVDTAYGEYKRAKTATVPVALQYVPFVFITHRVFAPEAQTWSVMQALRPVATIGKGGGGGG